MELSQEQQIKLESMQIKGIRRMIWKNIEKNIIESRLLSISGQGAISDLNKFINSQNRTTLIKLIKISPEITSVEIDEAYEKYRYGLKPGFTLFWVKRNINNTVTKEELEQKLKRYLSMLQFEDDAKFKDLKYTANIVFDDVYEISLDLMKMQFQIEELYSNGELSFNEKDSMIRHAFHCYAGRRESDQNCLYGKDSVRMQATKYVIQAVGRMCRTFLKSPEILIIAEEKLLEKVSAGEINKRVIPPEMDCIARRGICYANMDQKAVSQTACGIL